MANQETENVLPMAEDRSKISIKEYFELERVAIERSDWFEGEMFNMSGGTTNHSRIKMNLGAELHGLLKGGDCEVLDSDQRLRILSNGLRTYPDASVYCGTIEYDEEDEQRHTATNPSAVFEVLSESTEAYDRGLKAEGYRTIESLTAYVLISQERAHVEVYEKQEDKSWKLTEASGLGAEISVSSINVTLALETLYDRVKFDSERTDA